MLHLLKCCGREAYLVSLNSYVHADMLKLKRNTLVRVPYTGAGTMHWC